MNLSVIIPTKNRAYILKKALESITKQTMLQEYFEVLVIDNGSTDNTKEIVKSFFDKIKNLRYFYDETPGLHIGRHKGLKESKTNILVYADDDIEAFPTWLQTIKDSFEKDPKIVLVGGKNLPNYEEKPPEWILDIWNKNILEKVNGYLSILDFGDQIKEISPYYVFGCNFSVRKNIILEAGGFHPDGMPQNLIKYRGDGETYISEFIIKNGYKTLYNPQASVYHLVSKERLTIEYFKKRAFNQGISDSYTKIRNEYNSKQINKIKITSKLKSNFLNLYKIIFNKKYKDNIEKEISQSYQKGFKFHQKEVKSDKELLDWVLKESYIDL